MGVDLFFVLSGFLITRILLAARESNAYYRSFYGRRALRTFPLYYVYCAGAIGIWLFQHQVENVRVAPWLLTYLINGHIAVHDWSGAPDAVTHFWSLCVEEQFYLFWPLIIRRFDPGTVRRLCVTLLPTRAEPLLCGAWVALALYQSKNVYAPARLALRVSALFVFLAIYQGGSGVYTSRAMASYGVTAVAIMWASLLVVCLNSKAFEAAFSVAPLRFFSKYSYAIYVFGLLAASIATRIADDSQTLGAAVRRFGLSAVMSIGMALLSWRLIEAPFLSLKRYFPRSAIQPQT